jgi:capsular exopolysaccharide synthesis family protein
MTRLSDALKRAAETSPRPAVATEESPVTSADWRFAPVETMHVPDEPPAAPAELRGAGAERAEAPPLIDAVVPDAQPATPKPPVVAAAPHAVQFGNADRDKLVCAEGADPALVEQYRHLAAVLHHAQKASGVHTVMVTSALPSEGKTLTATNLALTLSESYQRRVLLIDADLRRPRMREMFALPPGDGLTDSLITARGDRLPVHQVTPHLWVLTSGRMLPDPMSLIVSPAMKQLIDDAKEAFDWVIVDTPPIAILPDANLLSAMIDTALLVVSAQSTPYPMVQRAAQAIGQNRILGVVLNRAEKTGLPASYGYYGYNQYQSQSGHPLPAKRRWFGWLRRSGSVPHVQ